MSKALITAAIVVAGFGVIGASKRRGGGVDAAELAALETFARSGGFGVDFQTKRGLSPKRLAKHRRFRHIQQSTCVPASIEAK
jgi:hypothetical protein